MRLNVAYSTDDKYAKYVGISMISLFENNIEFKDIYIYIIDNGIKEENREKLSDIANGYERKIVYIAFKEICKDLNTDGGFPISSYGRLFLGRLNDVDKIIYMDGDSIVSGSLIELWKMDISDYSVFGVQDTVENYYKTSIGLHKYFRYINAGFLLINLDKWRSDKTEKKFIQFIESFNGSVPHHDQGTLNAVCQNEIKLLHPKFNVQCPMFTFTDKQIEELYTSPYYSQKEITQAIGNPIFIHFTNGFYNRPWNNSSTHPLKMIYRQYTEKSPWKGEIENNTLNKKSQLMMKLYHFLPFRLFKTVNKLAVTRKYIFKRIKEN